MPKYSHSKHDDIQLVFSLERGTPDTADVHVSMHGCHRSPSPTSRLLAERPRELLAPASPSRSSASHLPAELWDLIIDAVAETNDTDEFPQRQKVNLASCSLTCRAWLPRSSVWLLNWLYFCPSTLDRYFPDTPDPSMEGGLMRFGGFLTHINQSSRLQTYVKGIWLTWCTGMPYIPVIVPLLISAVPNLSALRLRDVPYQGHYDEVDVGYYSLPKERWPIRFLDLGHCPMELPPQDWLFLSLRCFDSVDILRLTSLDIDRLWESVPTAKTHHLHVRRIEMSASSINITRVLKRIVVPGSVRELSIHHEYDYSRQDRAVPSFNSFLEVSCQNLEHFRFTSLNGRCHLHHYTPGESQCPQFSSNSLIPARRQFNDANWFELLYAPAFCPYRTSGQRESFDHYVPLRKLTEHTKKSFSICVATSFPTYHLAFRPYTWNIKAAPRTKPWVCPLKTLSIGRVLQNLWIITGICNAWTYGLFGSTTTW